MGATAPPNICGAMLTSSSMLRKSPSAGRGKATDFAVREGWYRTDYRTQVRPNTVHADQCCIQFTP